MKVKNPNELWVLNRTLADVSLSDLGVKIPAGKAANVYKINPYLKKSQVEDSKVNGSLAKRLEAGVLQVVKRGVNPDLPPAFKNVKESQETNVKAIKTKSSVVLEEDEEVETSDDGFGFADYGIGDINPKTNDDGAVVMKAKEDEVVKEESDADIKPKLETGVSKQSQIVMDVMAKNASHPAGEVAADAATNKPYTVAKPPSRDTAGGRKVYQDETGAVVVNDSVEQKPRKIREVKKAQESGEDYSLPGDDEVGADSAIEFEETPFDSKIATKTEDGSVIMKLKEEEPKKKKTIRKKKSSKKT